MLTAIFEGVLANYVPDGEGQKDSIYYKVKALAGVTASIYGSVDFSKYWHSSLDSVNNKCYITYITNKTINNFHILVEILSHMRFLRRNDLCY